MPSHSILILAPHPDDDVLGCGGTIRKYAERGDVVNLCIVTKAYQPQWSEEFINNRPNQVRKAADILGAKEVFFLTSPRSGSTHCHNRS
jgi:LmbE family N-acetylglucosaminyl deacetylase